MISYEISLANPTFHSPHLYRRPPRLYRYTRLGLPPKSLADIYEIFHGILQCYNPSFPLKTRSDPFHQTNLECKHIVIKYF